MQEVVPSNSTMGVLCWCAGIHMCGAHTDLLRSSASTHAMIYIEYCYNTILLFYNPRRILLIIYILYLGLAFESLVQYPLCKNAAWSNQDQQSNLMATTQTGWGSMSKHNDRYWSVLWFFTHRFWLPQPMQPPTKPDLLQNAINVQGCCWKLPLKIFFPWWSTPN